MTRAIITLYRSRRVPTVMERSKYARPLDSRHTRCPMRFQFRVGFDPQ